MDDTTLKALAASLNFRQLRQEIIASNIANAETPDYKAKRVEFEEALANAIDVDEVRKMGQSDKRHYQLGSGGFNHLSPRVVEDSNGEVNEDGNTVNRDEEMSKMVENRLFYDASVNLLNKKLSLMKYILNSER